MPGFDELPAGEPAADAADPTMKTNLLAVMLKAQPSVDTQQVVQQGARVVVHRKSN